MQCSYDGCKKRGASRKMFPWYHAILCKRHHRRVNILNGITIVGALVLGWIMGSATTILRYVNP